MKMTLLHINLCLLLTALLLPVWPAAGQGFEAERPAATQSQPAGAEASAAEEEIIQEDDWGPVVVLGLALVIMLVLIAAGAVVAIVGVIVAAILVLVAALSTSTLVGLATRRPSTAMKVLFLQLGAMGGLAAGIVLSLLAAWVLGLAHWRIWLVLAGAIAGAGGGVLAAVLFNFTWSRLLGMISRRLSRKASPA